VFHHPVWPSFWIDPECSFAAREVTQACPILAREVAWAPFFKEFMLSAFCTFYFCFLHFAFFKKCRFCILFYLGRMQKPEFLPKMSI
jgi:hypothetical protein